MVQTHQNGDLIPAGNPERAMLPETRGVSKGDRSNFWEDVPDELREEFFALFQGISGETQGEDDEFTFGLGWDITSIRLKVRHDVLERVTQNKLLGLLKLMEPFAVMSDVERECDDIVKAMKNKEYCGDPVYTIPRIERDMENKVGPAVLGEVPGLTEAQRSALEGRSKNLEKQLEKIRIPAYKYQLSEALRTLEETMESSGDIVDEVRSVFALLKNLRKQEFRLDERSKQKIEERLTAAVEAIKQQALRLQEEIGEHPSLKKKERGK